MQVEDGGRIVLARPAVPPRRSLELIEKHAVKGPHYPPDYPDALRRVALAGLTAVSAESLIVPVREGAAAVASFEQFLAELEIQIAPITFEIGRVAAQLHAHQPSLRLPDALVLTTGEELGAHAVLTADAAWPRVGPRAQLI